MFNQSAGYGAPNFGPNLQIQPPAFQQNAFPSPAPFSNPVRPNTQHVFGSSAQYGLPSQAPSTFVPNLSYIMSTPPPSLIPPRPQQNFADWNKNPPPQVSPVSPTFMKFIHESYSNGITVTPGISHHQRDQLHPLSTAVIRPSDFQQQFYNNERPGPSASFTPQPEPHSSQSSLHQQSYPSNSQGTFTQNSPNSNNFPYRNHNGGGQQHNSTQNSPNSNNFPYRNHNGGGQQHNSRNHNSNNNPFKFNFNSQNRRPNGNHSHNNRNGRQNNGNRQLNGFGLVTGIKKEREDKFSKPFTCDPCDRAFGSDSELKEHLSEHVKCNIDGCPFEAHTKIVDLHIKNQHGKGRYAEKINKLSSIEEIEKWRAERRRRFPTQENIARRLAEKAEKEARGEVCEKPESNGKMQSRDNQQSCKPRNAYKRRRRRNHHWGNQHPFSDVKVEKDLESESSNDEPCTKMAKFAGVNAVFPSEADNSINTSSETSDNVFKENACSLPESESVEVEISQCNASSNAQENSGKDVTVANSSPDISGTEKDSVDEISVNGNASKEGLTPNPSSIVVYDVTDEDDEAPTELSSKAIPSILAPAEGSPVQCPSENLVTVNETESVKKKYERAPRKDYDRPKREFIPRKKEEPKRCSLSLLKGLYADEIKTERNKIFQCVRYIVQNEYFGIGSEK